MHHGTASLLAKGISIKSNFFHVSNIYDENVCHWILLYFPHDLLTNVLSYVFVLLLIWYVECVGKHEFCC